MKPIICFAVCALGLAACAAPASNHRISEGGGGGQADFRSCVDREAPLVVDAAVKRDKLGTIYGYHTSIENEVIARCGSETRATLADDLEAPSDPDVAYVRTAVEARVRVYDDAEIKSETAELGRQMDQAKQEEQAEQGGENQAGKAYSDCLAKHARTLALVSSETADVVAEAALPSCREEHAALYSVVEKYHDAAFASALVDRIDEKLRPALVLEIVKARALRLAPAPKKTAPKSDAPI